MVLENVIQNADSVREVSADIFSVVDSTEHSRVYDGNAKAYDRVIGSWLYNKLVWGNAPADYASFTQRALDSGDGVFLDAGCGSLVFTAASYANADRPLVLADLSLGMLGEARQRLIDLHGSIPANVVLVQADLLTIAQAFRPQAFTSVGCFGIIHLFEDAAQILNNLRDLVVADGQLFFTSLVAEGGARRRYMSQLQRMNEFATPRTTTELRSHLDANDLAPALTTTGGMAYGVIDC